MAISLGEHSIALDSRDDAANVNFVSHAHSDHTSGIRKGKKTLASIITKELIEGRTRKKVELMDEPDCVTLLNAGHILGSKQLHIQNDLLGYSILYSGDYQISEPIAAEKIEIKQADVLIIDSTYPYPDLKFDDRNEVVTSIQHYARMKMGQGHVVFGAYTLGKAQDLVKILNEAGITPAADEKVALMNDVYNRHGARLEYVPLDENTRENIVAVVGQSKIGSMRERISSSSGKRVFTAVASGWTKMFRYETDVQFNLSDHADFYQALDYINACGPKIVFTFGPNARLFARNLAARGYDSRPILNTSDANCLLLNKV